MGIGEYPPEFNPKIHGPYNPGRYYGKADVPLGEVKVGQLGSWLSRRSFSPQAMFNGVCRAQWRWAQKYLLVKKGSFAPFAQFVVCLSTFYYFLQYRAHTNHRHTKYHCGMQVQCVAGRSRPSDKTVSGVLKKCLKMLSPQNEVKIVTSSRTDAEVHALCSSVHVDLLHRCRLKA
ncbi:hypothetical protein ScPMuIL_003859 [Solemya velum]